MTTLLIIYRTGERAPNFAGDKGHGETWDHTVWNRERTLELYDWRTGSGHSKEVVGRLQLQFDVIG